MIVSGAKEIFLVGCLGGVLAEIARWFELRTSPGFPAYAREFKYWAATICMIVAGGLLAIAYGVELKKRDSYCQYWRIGAFDYQGVGGGHAEPHGSRFRSRGVQTVPTNVFGWQVVGSSPKPRTGTC